MTAHWLDRLYVRLTPAGSFFGDGWGDEGAIEAHLDALARPAEPSPIDLAFVRTRRVRRGIARDGVFTSPLAHALPARSSEARVRLLLPDASPRPAPVCILLAATGDEGLDGRSRFAAPLLARGIGALVLENPLYGTRRPAGQRGVAVRTVADLVAMGRATIEEARALASWLRTRGHAVGLSGYSMGGQMAALSAALCPFPVAVVAGAAPHAARVVFVDGLLARATAFGVLARGMRSEGQGHEGVDVRARLARVLEGTSATRLPAPAPGSAAVLLGARHDGYVHRSAVEALARHWPEAELRWLDGGHVTGFLQHEARRRAIVDAFGRLG